MTPAPASETRRIDGVDLLRGLAIVMMIAYHFCYDLVYFRWAAWRMLEDPRWIAWRTVILSSFLLLAGVSLALRAHFRPTWRDFWRRWVQIAAAAALVTVGSALLFPRSYIYFGVLHHIALALVAARLMLGLGAWNAPIGTAIVALGAAVGFDVMNPKSLNWIGFATLRPYTEDYVPVFPWFGLVLIGVAIGQVWVKRGLPALPGPQRARAGMPEWITRGLTGLGRWGLTAYLLHQPILLSALWILHAMPHTM